MNQVLNGITPPALVQNILDKMQYLQASALITARNIAESDIPGTRKRELRPFEELMKSKPKRSDLKISAHDTVDTKEMIYKEREVLALQNTSHDYTALTQIYRRYHEMIRIAIGKA